MKKYIAISLLPIILMLSSCETSANNESVEIKQNSSKNVTINVYNWGEYISDGSDGSVDVNREFTRETGIKVNYTMFSSNEELYAKLLGGGVDYDIIIPSDYMLAKLAQEDMLAKINFANIPNYSLISDEFKTDVEYDPDNLYSVPYLWGMVGIIYNIEKVDDVVDSWEILWNEKYKKQIFMFDNPRDAFGIAQELLGYSYNTTNKDEWKSATKLLKEQKPLVQAYAMDQILDKMANNEAALAPYYSGDALTLRGDNENIRFAVPKEGTNVFVDAFCIPKNSVKKAQAEAYINYMCSTDAAYANAEYIAYSSPQKEAAELHKEYLLEEFGEEGANISYPSSLDNTEIFTNLPTETNLLIDELWIMVKVGGGDNPYTIVVVIGLFFALWLGIAIYMRRKKKRGILDSGKVIISK